MDAKVKFIKVENLHFDPKNPRLPESSVNKSDEEVVINWMLKDASIIELMGSIGEKGFFPAEPLLVVEIDDNPGHYHVVEGNRRLSAVKLLLNPSLADKRAITVQAVFDGAKQKPTHLPAFVYDEREEILDYLGFKHITGVKSWKPLAKARYLSDLQVSYKDLPLKEQHQNLAKAIGSRSDYVQQLLIGLLIFKRISDNDYFDIEGLNEGNIDFGVYYNALRWKNIRTFIGVDVDSEDPMKDVNLDNLKDLVKWVSEKNSENKTRLGESRNLSKLNEVLGVTKARIAFSGGKSLDDSLILTEEPDNIFSESISQALEKMQISNRYVALIEKWTNADVENLKEIRSLSGNMRIILVTKEIEED